MKLVRVAVGIAMLSLTTSIVTGQQQCAVTVKANIEIAPGEFSLADLLTPGSCSALRRAATRVRMGKAPLAGSVRVLRGEDVAMRLETLAPQSAIGAIRVRPVPERITIRRTGARVSCAEIGAEIFPDSPPRAIECGAAGRIAQNTPLELTRSVWDPAVGGWNVSARCVHRADCVPFLLRVRGDLDLSIPTVSGDRSSIQAPTMIPPRPLAPSFSNSAVRPPLVRQGDQVTLLWDQDGIRLTMRAVSLDAGGLGQPVRARVTGGTRIVHAVVEGTGVVRRLS